MVCSMLLDFVRFMEGISIKFNWKFLGKRLAYSANPVLTQDEVDLPIDIKLILMDFLR